ncbi:hypothetical protein F5X96DRAFT_643635 [Biscogniauxia mediterranea]|nr:hypothetical protein F5X96DRAFT_643635 [Biscogniauxia mediterranea]
MSMGLSNTYGYNMPAVQSHYQRDQDHNFYRHTDYNFGGFSAQTYTGAAIGLDMAGATDTLMDSDSKALKYLPLCHPVGCLPGYRDDVTKANYDENDGKLARTTTWFNNYHEYRADEFLANIQGPSDSTKLYYSSGKTTAAYNQRTGGLLPDPSGGGIEMVSL